MMLLGYCVELFFDGIFIAALLMLACWFFRILFGIFSGAANSVADTFRWTKSNIKRKKESSYKIDDDN